MTTSGPTPRSAGNDRWLGLLLYVAAAIAFWPISHWIIAKTAALEQIRQSLVILAFVAILLVVTDRQRLQLWLHLDRLNLSLLAGAFALAGAAYLAHFAPLALLGYLLGLASAAHFAFGPRYFRLARWLIIGFGVFLGLVLLFPVLDWPLRKLAGVEAAHMLKWLGLAPRLAIANPADPQLILSVNGRSFEVATDCNGFGLISSGTLLALLLALATRAPVWWKIAVTLFATVLAFFINAVRILCISLLAPSFPNHYILMHDTIGAVALFIGLGVIWWAAYLPDAFGQAAKTAPGGSAGRNQDSR